MIRVPYQNAFVVCPVRRFQKTVDQPVPNPDEPVIPVPTAVWSRTGLDPSDGSTGLLVCGADP